MLIPLGTNGFYPSFARQTMSFLLVDGDRALLLDAGTGVGRLAHPTISARLERVETLTVILSHYHLDHVVGLSILPAVWNRPITLYAPEPPLVDGVPGEALPRLLAPPLFPRKLEDFPVPVEIVPYAGPELSAGGFRIRTRRQRHPGGSAGLRVDDLLAYCTDTAADAGSVELARDVPTLLHEVWLTTAEARHTEAAASGHSSAVEVAQIAKSAEVARLVPVHHHPTRDDTGLQQIIADLEDADSPPVLLPEEGEPIPVA